MIRSTLKSEELLDGVSYASVNIAEISKNLSALNQIHNLK